MEKVNIQFGGMSNTPDNTVCNDGDMALLVNMRHKDGCLVPRENMITANLADEVIKKVVLHKESSTVFMLTTNARLYSAKENSSDTKLEYTDTKAIKEGVQEFNIVGNIVIVYLNNSIEYLIYRDGEFVDLGELPGVPEMRIDKTDTYESVDTSEYYYYGGTYSDNYDYFKNNWIKASKGYFDKCLDAHYKKGGYIDNALFIVGLRLFDGSYRYSHLHLVRDENNRTGVSNNFGAGSKNFYTMADISNHETGGLGKMRVYIAGFNVRFNFQYNFSDWKDIITSVDVFTSGSIMEHEAVTHEFFVRQLGKDSNGDGYNDILIPISRGNATFYSNKSIPKLRDEILSCGTFYKVASYNLEGKSTSSFIETSPSNLAVQEMLPLSNTKEIYANKSYVYNNRLHVFDYKEGINMAGANMFIDTTKSYSQAVAGEMFVKMQDGTVVKKTCNVTNNSAGALIISHPTRGVKETFVNFVMNGTAYHRQASLFDHEYLDMSVALPSTMINDWYYIEYQIVHVMQNMEEGGELSRITLNAYKLAESGKISEGKYEFRYEEVFGDDFGWCLNGVKQEWLDDYISVKIGNAGSLVGAVIYMTVIARESSYNISLLSSLSGTRSERVVDKRVTETQKLKVSAVDNPFFFPTAQTYSFNDGIVGLGNNIAAVSAGQFGQYPLIVFTQNGVWAMSVDTGGGAYGSKTILSNDVCVGGICNTNRGVVFASNKGIMRVSGSVIEMLSAQIDGYPIKLSGNCITQIIEEGFWGKGDYSTIKPIRDLVKDCVIAYDMRNEEIFVSQRNCRFSYVYDMNNNNWSVIGETFLGVVENSDEFKVFYENTTDDSSGIMKYNPTRKQNYILLITRPIKAGTLNPKRMRRAALRGGISVANPSFYVLASQDGENFVCIGGSEYLEFNDSALIARMTRSRQYRYFALAVVGLTSDTISFAELLIDRGFMSNKLR